MGRSFEKGIIGEGDLPLLNGADGLHFSLVAELLSANRSCSAKPVRHHGRAASIPVPSAAESEGGGFRLLMKNPACQSRS